MQLFFCFFDVSQQNIIYWKNWDIDKKSSILNKFFRFFEKVIFCWEMWKKNEKNGRIFSTLCVIVRSLDFSRPCKVLSMDFIRRHLRPFCTEQILNIK